MKKSNQKFTVTVAGNGGTTTSEIGTRSNVANLVRNTLNSATAGTITFTVVVTDLPKTEKVVTE